MIFFVLVKILVLLPGIPSVSFNVRKRLLATAVPLVVIVSWIGPRLARPGDSPVLAHARIAPSSEQESQSRLASLGRKLSLLEQQLDRLGVKAPSGSGGRGGPEVPITLAMLDQDADTLHERVKSLFSHREALRAQFRRRYAIDVPWLSSRLGCLWRLPLITPPASGCVPIPGQGPQPPTTASIWPLTTAPRSWPMPPVVSSAASTDPAMA